MWLAVTGYIVSVTFARYHVRLSKASCRYGGSVRTDRRGLSRVVNLTCDKLGFINANIKKGKSTAYTSVRATIWDPHFRWYLNFLIFPYSLVEGRRKLPCQNQLDLFSRLELQLVTDEHGQMDRAIAHTMLV